MIIPERAFLALPTPTPDFAVVASPPPSKHNVIKPIALREGEMIICLDHDNWYLAEVNAVYPNKARVRYYSTPTPPLDSYGDTLIPERVKRLQQVRFRKTWFFRDGPNAGKGTVSPPFPDNPDLRVWDGDIPASAYSKELLIRNVRFSGEGSLDSSSVQLAANLPYPHATYPTVEDERNDGSTTYFTLCERDLTEVAHCTLCNCCLCHPSMQ